MGTEQLRSVELSSQVTSLGGKAMLVGEHIAGPFLRYGLENILTATDVEYEEDFANEFIESVNNGYLPIIVGNHQTHLDGITISLVSRSLTNVANEHLPKDQKLKGFALLLASSLYSGHQGAMMKGFFEETAPVMERRGLYPILHTRPKDRKDYKMKSESLGQFRELVELIDNSYAIAAFPEGTTTAGKTNPDGKPNGMQPFLPSSIRMLIGAANEAGKKAMIIPVSLSGGPSIYSPDTKLPTSKSMKIGFFPNGKSPINIFVGSPMLSDQGELKDLFKSRSWEGLNTLVASKIASHLPEIERGRYI